MNTSRKPQIGYLWLQANWYCPECGEGYDGDATDEVEVVADLDRHNLIHHGRKR